MDVNLGKLQEMVRDKEVRHVAVHGFVKSRGWAGRWAGGGARAFVCAPARARPPGFPAPVALTCQELELFVWGGARPEEVVPRVWAEAAPQVGSSQTKRALTSARSWDCLPLGSECWP